MRSRYTLRSKKEDNDAFDTENASTVTKGRGRSRSNAVQDSFISDGERRSRRTKSSTGDKDSSSEDSRKSGSGIRRTASTRSARKGRTRSALSNAINDDNSESEDDSDGSINGKIPSLVVEVDNTKSLRLNLPSESGSVRSAATLTPASPSVFARRLSTADFAQSHPLEPLTFTRHPLKTARYFCKFLVSGLGDAAKYVKDSQGIHMSLTFLAVASGLWYLGALVTGKTEEFFWMTLDGLWKHTSWYGYWFVLGILSSVGLGSGLHTFVLFLGPFIAAVAIAANACQSLDFVTLGGSTDFHCNTEGGTGNVTIAGIYLKIALESFVWGLGTAVGELPPYFVARGSTSTTELDDIEAKSETDRNLFDRLKLGVGKLVKTAGFWGILLCASIPNPLFDLAGIICGSFGVSFWTFFGATAFGKACVKATIQSFFVVAMFSPGGMALVLDLVPHPVLKTKISDFLNVQMDKYRGGAPSPPGGDIASNDSAHFLVGLAGWAWSLIVTGMLSFFVLKAIESFANQEYEREALEQRQKSLKQD